MSTRALTDQMGRTIEIAFPPCRIVSLVPSITETLFDLGAGDSVIGVTKFCIHPAEGVAGKIKIGGTKKLNLSRIIALQPGLIVGAKEENTQTEVEALARRFPVYMSDVQTLAGALEMIRHLGVLTGSEMAAAGLTQCIQSEFDALPLIERPKRTAYLIWQNPYMAAGGGTFINDLLCRAGFQNVFSDLTRYPEISAEGLSAAAPDVVLLSSEPYPFKEKHLNAVRQICPAAKVVLADGELFSWYGSRLLKAADYFRLLKETLC